MGFKIQKDSIYQVIFIACVAIPYLNNYELTFGVWSLTVLFTLKKKYSLSIIKLISFFVAILLIALFSSFFQDFKAYNFIRDITYLLKPIIGLLVGYQLCKSVVKKPLNMAINAGVFLAIAHLLIILYNITFLSIRTMHELRIHSGYFSDYEVYTLILLLFYKNFQIDIPKKTIQWYIIILAISGFFYLARTNFIQFIVLYLALKGYFVLNRKSIIALTSLVVITLIGYSAIVAYNPNRGAKGFEAFLYKIKNAPIEPFKTKIDVDDWKDFNDNYRSYETILTLRQVPKGGIRPVLIGEGLGSSIDLKKKVWLQSSFMRYIPFLHNGFMTVFLKAGILGVIILLFSIRYFFINKPTSNPLIRSINFMLIGTGVFLVLSYWVFMGFYFVPDSKSIFIGLLICFKENIQKNIALHE